MKFAERYQDILKRNKAFLDVHLTNRCNLNCCQRLSPLCDSETIADLVKYDRVKKKMD